MDNSHDVVMQRPHLNDVPDLLPLEEGYSLKQLSSQDEEALASLLSLAFEETWDAKRVQKQLTQANDVKASYGIFYNNELVATGSSQYLPERATKGGFLHWIATHPEHRRKGLAVSLIKWLFEDFKARDYETAWLNTQTYRTAAIKAYLNLGFLPVCSEKNEQLSWSKFFQNLDKPHTFKS